jgi:hypothetical protein
MSQPKFDPAVILDPAADPESDWARHLRAGDAAAARDSLVRLLREGPSRIDLEQSIPAIRIRWFGTPINHLGGDGFDADDVVNLRYSGTYGIVHQFEGEIDWHYDGSHGSTPEWTWQMNRHLHWINLADAYRESANAKYAVAWEKELRSWIEQCPRPDDAGRQRGSAWRTLDTGIRAGSTWPYAFEIFRRSPHVTDEAIWLLFAAQRENALHLQRFPAGGNWVIMETNGLGHAGLMFPELKDASLFTATAVERAQREISAQFFPDGTHQEFAPHYAAAGCIANFYALARLADRNEAPLPGDFWDSLRRLVLALARIADPEGIAPGLHNSLPIDINHLFADVVASHAREEVSPPWTQPVSDFLPHGGYAVFRRPGSYGMFNAGPRGTAHFHDDDLQFISYVHGRHFAVDPGSPRYTNEPLSRHLRTSAAHNVVLLNGALHEPAVKISRPHSPMPFSFHGEGPVQAGAAKRTLLQTTSGAEFQHERLVLDIEGLGWVIFDRLTPPDGEKHSWEWIWQMPVDEADASANSAVASYDNGPGMRIVSTSNVPGSYTVTRGEQEEEPRGWMNRRGATEYLPIPAFRYITEPEAGAVWAMTVHAPHPAGAEGKALQLEVAETAPGRWSARILRDGNEFRIDLAGGDEIQRVAVHRDGVRLATLSLGNHTLQKP